MLIEEIVDFDRYPLQDVESSAAKAVIANCRERLQSRGTCQLDGFVREAALAAMTSEAKTLLPKAHQQNDWFSPYIGDKADGLPADHPRRAKVRTAQAALAWDLIPANSPLRTLYTWGGLTTFLAAILEKPRLYCGADPLAACNLAYIGPGDELGWHFDSSEFSVTLQIQAPEDGGEFEFAPNTRSQSNENYDMVKAILNGDKSHVVTSKSVPGTLSVFRGHHSLHRVTPVSGKRARITGVLTFAEEPDFHVSETSRKLFYGRVA